MERRLREKLGATWCPSMEGTIKFGKSQGLHLLVNFFPSFNKILSASSSLVPPLSAGRGWAGQGSPLRKLELKLVLACMGSADRKQPWTGPC